VGFLDAILGRKKQAQPNLDALFSVPTAALTLQSAAEIRPTGVGAVCFREMEGGPFARLKDEMTALMGGVAPEEHRDGYGYTWLVIRDSPEDVSGLVTHLHAANTTLEGSGFGPALLCSTIGFRSATGQSLALVYLYKQGTFYPFAPVDSQTQQRDSALELQVRAMISDELNIEKDLSRWFPVWGAPGL
jgi:hypothetical protein